MSLSFENVLDLLNITITVGNQDSVDSQRFSDFNGTFRDRLEGRVGYFQSKGRTFSFDNLQYCKIEIDDLNGKQVLRMLISLTNNKEQMKDGNCFVFLVNNEPDTSLTVFYSYCWCEPRGVLAEFEHEKGLFVRAFDDTICSERQTYPHFVGYGSQTLEKIRSPLSEQYEIYMKEKICNLEPKYRRLFWGVVFEIAKCHVRNWKVYKHLKNFPTASIIKLAIDNGLSGKLQAVFNEHNITKDVFKEISPQLSEEERLSVYHARKDELRKEGAKLIIDKIFSPTAEGKYDKCEVTKVADEMKSFYL